MIRENEQVVRDLEYKNKELTLSVEKLKSENSNLQIKLRDIEDSKDIARWATVIARKRFSEEDSLEEGDMFYEIVETHTGGYGGSVIQPQPRIVCSILSKGTRLYGVIDPRERGSMMISFMESRDLVRQISNLNYFKVEKFFE